VKTYPNIAIQRNPSVAFNHVWDSQNEEWIPMSQNPYDVNLSQAKSSIHKFGSLPTIASKTTEETIWDGAGLYQFPSNDGISLTISSSNTNDNQSFVVIGLDENFLEQTWEGNLNGLNDVSISGTWTRVFRAYNNGSTDLEGDVSIKDGSTIHAKVLAQHNQTLMAVYTIPDNYTGKLLKIHASANNTDTSSGLNALCHLKTREYNKVFRTRNILSFSDSQPLTEELTFPLTLPPRTDIYINKISSSSTGGTISAEFDIALL